MKLYNFGTLKQYYCFYSTEKEGNLTFGCWRPLKFSRPSQRGDCGPTALSVVWLYGWGAQDEIGVDFPMLKLSFQKIIRLPILNVISSCWGFIFVLLDGAAMPQCQHLVRCAVLALPFKLIQEAAL
jgi:hypothetical protein